MGQKVNPIGLRLGINRTWDSRWYEDRGYRKLLQQDLEIRAFFAGRSITIRLIPAWARRFSRKARISRSCWSSLR